MANNEAIQGPPWRALAEEVLRAKDPERYRDLKASGMLSQHLRVTAERAKMAYEATARRIEKQNPGQGAWALQAAEEIVIRDVLDPTA